ncbi:Nif3-like dinuclear metal center hexameric protein [Catenulispora sp. NL8]|uniref:GTP cyclohydrolase 1 type 2 homolog n=1 Tax=Catenulispora pinistramenti TaxID=2705254 RepID=A0ABS5KRN2_9ACTN|nr:Nif3-like dinuclear metal center hexameric protein [Catenulispora pinistramenti]MBS2548707.1 Nif3-like dinuclear metal center hexameric protein [Catenulispora pinistramenti]
MPQSDAAPAAAAPAPTLRDVVAILERVYDPTWAEPWDAVGLVCGDPDAPVRTVGFAVDPVAAVIEEALDRGADLLVTHHPLFLRGVHGVPATTFKGRLVHQLIRGGTALFTAHTNADSADPGVSDALARALDLHDLRPLEARAGNPELGIGRVGELAEAEPLARFAARVAAALPATAGGLRIAGHAETPVRRVAVCGGAGDTFFDAVRASGADVYVTADLRHHPASEAVEAGGPALIDVAHWASEWPWLEHAAETLRSAVAAAGTPTATGTNIETYVSTLITDPWDAQLPSR